jgi:hypothetical protein
MAPPGGSVAFSPRCIKTAVTPETLIRDTHRLIEAAGIDRSANWVTKTVRGFLRSSFSGVPFGQYLAARLELTARQRADMLARSDLRYVLEYADPTGEAAVRNVMAARP